MKSLQDYQKLNYKMEIEFNTEEKAYFVTFPELPGCMADGRTPNEAIKEAMKAKNKWLEIALQSEWTVPEPSQKIETSGRLTTRLPKYLHQKLIIRAAQEGVSQNQLIATYIAEGLERSTTADMINNFEKKVCSIMMKLEPSTAATYSNMDRIQYMASNVYAGANIATGQAYGETFQPIIPKRILNVAGAGIA